MTTSSPPPAVSARRQIWPLIAGVGTALAVAGAIDLGLGVLPLEFGVPEWEFGAIGNFLNRLPMFALGLTMLLTASLGLGWTRRGVLSASMLLLTSLVVLVFALFFATNVPVVLRSASSESMRIGVLKASVKAAIQAAVYVLAFFSVAVYGIRSAMRAGRRR